MARFSITSYPNSGEQYIGAGNSAQAVVILPEAHASYGGDNYVNMTFYSPVAPRSWYSLSFMVSLRHNGGEIISTTLNSYAFKKDTTYNSSGIYGVQIPVWRNYSNFTLSYGDSIVLLCNNSSGYATSYNSLIELISMEFTSSNAYGDIVIDYLYVPEFSLAGNNGKISATSYGTYYVTPREYMNVFGRLPDGAWNSINGYVPVTITGNSEPYSPLLNYYTLTRNKVCAAGGEPLRVRS